MYRRIAAAIQEFDARSERDPRKSAQPTDYLSFYCLAKQESPKDQPESLQEPRPGSEAGTLVLLQFDYLLTAMAITLRHIDT